MQDAQDRRRESGPNRTMLRRTLFLLAACGIVAFSVLAARLYQLQIVRHDEYEAAAISQQLRETTVSAARGAIYDRNGAVLAMSAGVETVCLSPAEIRKYGEDAEAIARGLSEILGVDYETVYKKTQNTKSWYEVVARKVEADVAEAVRSFKEAGGYAGIKLEPDTKRYYPYGSLAAHVIGFVGTDNTGLGGIEAKYDEALAGTAGRVVRATTAGGTDLLYTSFEDFYDAQDGESVTLTIDAGIQYFVEKHLAQAVEDYDVRGGAAAICMEVDTGAILSMASLGNFDLNDFQAISEQAQAYIDATARTEEERAALLAEAQQRQWRNKAISDTYEPGSTFKIITLAMALEEGLVSESSSYFCGGAVNVLGRTTPVKCWRTTGHGPQTLTQAVQHSCNVAFVNIGLAVGSARFYDYAEAFGFLERQPDTDVMLTAKTGLDLGGESGSIWWAEDTFCNEQNLSQLAAASFGQTFNITPLQLITAVSACVNGGRLMQPYLVQRVTDAEGGLVAETAPTAVRQVVSAQTSAALCRILEQVVADPNEGTGRNAYVAGYRIGGKTGTSTDTTHQAETGEKEYIVSFLGFAPADDPEVALLVLLDDPGPASGVYVSGGQMAAPVVGKMLADILPYLGYAPQYTDAEAASADRAVPALEGLSLADARAALAEAGLSCRVIGEGDAVTAQLPRAGQVIAAGSEIIVYAGATPSAALETVPDLSGLTYAEARQRLAWYGVYIRAGGSVTDAGAQRVLCQSVPAGSAVAHGTVVEVTLVSTGSEQLGEY